MNIKDKKPIIILIVTILVLVIGVSLAYFGLTIIGNDTAKKNKIVTGNLELTFTDNDEISLSGVFPGDYITKTITVKNTGSREASYNLVWTELTNEFINDEITIELTCETSEFCNSVPQKAVSNSNIASNISIDAGLKHIYTVKITFIDTGKPQNYNKNKSFSGKLGITESSAKTVYCKYNGDIKEGVKYINGQYTYTYIQDGGWEVNLTDIHSTDPVTSEVCTYINNTPIISMAGMFFSSQATSIDISSINTSNVTNMEIMFADVQTSTLDLSSFNTSKVTNMRKMFDGSSVETINLSSFDTSNVTSMYAMFRNSAKIETLDLNSFDTSKVKDMSEMFNMNDISTNNLKTIYVSDKFKISEDVDGWGMFNKCIALVGGAGTKYSNDNKNDQTFAHIDGGTSNPGYFTDIIDKDIPEPNSFATDSWKTIAKAVRNDNISKYNVGNTKTIDMGTYGTHTVRIANTSIPSECNTDGFSQTACGFVLEFVDIITTHNMNDTATNVGGWPASSMYTFVNNDIYNALPIELRNVIIDTVTVSGHGSTSGETNFTSTDKLYLLSTAEIYADLVDDLYNNNIGEHDSGRSFTRQLDYYKSKGTTSTDWNAALKSYDYFWWLRPARNDDDRAFFSVCENGGWNYDMAHITNGVSPAFRIG